MVKCKHSSEQTPILRSSRPAIASFAGFRSRLSFDVQADIAHCVRSLRRLGVFRIAGVVLENSLRRICRKYENDDKDVSLDNLISELAKRAILSSTKAKRTRAAAHYGQRQLTLNGMNST